MKPALVAGFVFGMPIENKDQVFHRILDLKHGLGFYPGFFYSPALLNIL
jgi:hypothetical protein